MSQQEAAAAAEAVVDIICMMKKTIQSDVEYEAVFIDYLITYQTA